MKRQHLPMAALSLTLLLLLALPVLFARWEERALLDQVTPFPVETDVLAREEAYDLWDRLAIVQDSTVVWQSERSNYTEGADENSRALVQAIETQLTELQRRQALPPLDLSGAVQVSVTKETFLRHGSSAPGDALELWVVHAAYPGFLVYAHMDRQTFTLYDLSVQATEDNFRYPQGITADGFWDYLTAITPFDDTDQEQFRPEAFYDKRSIHLFLVSEHRDTGALSYYCLHRSSLYADLQP